MATKKHLVSKKEARFLLVFARKNPFRVFTFVVVLVFLLFLPGQGYYETLHLEYRPPLVRASEFDDYQVSSYPQRVGKEPMPTISAQSVVITDLDSAVPMLELNPEERLRPASLTKLMTALVVLDYYDLDQVLTVKRLAPLEEESEMGLAVGDRLTVRNLLYGLLVSSGNDAAYTLADNYPGGIENFIYSMNKKAEQLHLNGTRFANPSGFDGPDQYTSARDISLLTAQALKSDLVNRIVTTYGINLGDATGSKSYYIKNVNKLLGYVYGVDGVKTGFTDEAGQCLVSSVSRDGHRIVIVMLKSNDRFGESAGLIEWVFRNFQWVNPTEILTSS